MNGPSSRDESSIAPEDRPSVLFLTGHLPYPPLSGGRRREFELVSRLSHRFAFHLVVVSKTPHEDEANAPAFQPHCESVSIFPAGFAGRAEVSPPLPSLALRHWAPRVQSLVETRLANHNVDVVHVEGFYLMHHLPAASPLPVLLVEQNVEYMLWHQRMRRSRGRKERRRNVTEYAMTLQAEIDAWRRSTLCAAVTDEDRATMLAAVPNLVVRLIPDGADHVPAIGAPSEDQAARLPVEDGRPTVAFVANFGYAPNVDAALYLARQILPEVAFRILSVRLLLVGNAPPPEIRALQDDRIVVTGRVPSVEPYLDAADVAVCPLREGGGVKVKVLEALKQGKAIVTTSIGAQGLNTKGAEAMLVRDDARSFAGAVITLLADEAERSRLEHAARDFWKTLPTWEESAEALARCYLELTPAPEGAVRPSPERGVTPWRE
jgi:glycosyltransferase involved in cell wall biosynthesis